MQLRALSAHLEYVREEERRLMALEVHDTLGQALTGLKINLSLLGKKLSGDSDLEGRVAAMSGMVDNTIQTVRDISTQLRPGLLDDLGLVATLEWLLKKFEEMTGIKCSFVSNTEHCMLDRDLSVALFRISQEALTNVARHAEAGRVKVSLLLEDDYLVLEVADDGRGISVEKVLSHSSVGITGMRERMLAFGGNVIINGKKGEGTTLVASIPLSNAVIISQVVEEEEV
jgi:signal transduction histidine kinase